MRPDLAQDTWLVPVSSLPLSLLTSLSTPASGRHRVELERNNLQVNVTAYSPEVVGEAINAREYFVERSAGQSLDTRPSGVPSSLLREWVGMWDEKSFALRFRGLNALYVPQRQG